jgi:uncharacterized cupin superfamily protein
VDERPNVLAERFSIERDGLRGERVLAKAGCKELGGTLYELAPGSAPIPLHIHHAMEEAMVVLAGTPTLRTLEGERELAMGEVVAFPRGRQGAHAICNRSQEPARYLMLSTLVYPEVVEYPENETVRAVTRPPLSEPEPGEDRADRMLLFDRADAKR